MALWGKMTTENTQPHPTGRFASPVKYPNITVRLVGNDGNAFSILARCTREMRRAKLPTSEVDAFLEEARAGDYDDLLTTCMRWFDVC